MASGGPGSHFNVSTTHLRPRHQALRSLTLKAGDCALFARLRPERSGLLPLNPLTFDPRAILEFGARGARGPGDTQQRCGGRNASLVTGAISMAAGEYVSIYSQMDIEQAEFARERRAHDALGAYARDERDLFETFRARPIQAASASACSFTVGAVLPLFAIPHDLADILHSRPHLLVSQPPFTSGCMSATHFSALLQTNEVSVAL